MRTREGLTDDGVKVEMAKLRSEVEHSRVSDRAAFVVEVVATLKAAGLTASGVEILPNGSPQLRPARPAKPWTEPRRSYRGRALTGSLDDFRDGLELLERDTCASDADRCVPGRGGQRCRRHTRRSERRRQAA